MMLMEMMSSADDEEAWYYNQIKSVLQVRPGRQTKLSLQGSVDWLFIELIII